MAPTRHGHFTVEPDSPTLRKQTATLNGQYESPLITLHRRCLNEPFVIVIITFLATTSCIAQSQRQGTVTSIPSTSLDEPTSKTCAGTAPTVAPRFGIDIRASSTSVQSGDPINIVVTINNITNQDIPWSPGYDDVRITVRHGSIEAPRTALHRYLRGEPAPGDAALLTSGSRVTLFVPRHKTASQTLNIGKVYEFTDSGNYTVVVQRYDEMSDVFVRSNALTISLSK